MGPVPAAFPSVMGHYSIKDTSCLRQVTLFVLFCLACSTNIKTAGQQDTEELIEGPYKSQFQYDFNGDRIPDLFSIDWKIVRDYGIDPWTKIQSNEKYIWFQANFRISSSTGKVYHDDTFSMKEDDYLKMVSIIGRDDMTPYYYFKNFFSIPKFESKLNEVTSYGISKEEIDEEYIAKLIESEKSSASSEAVVAELTKGVHIVVVYRRDWHEDLGIIVYSKLLDRSIFLVSPYDR